jgi:hypothetical protein
MHRILPLMLVVPMLGALGCGRSSLAGKTSTDMANLPRLAPKVRMAQKVVLYEGLPHQTFEPKLLEAELAEKKTVKLAGYSFYTEPLVLTEEDATSLGERFSSETTFEPWRGEKKCGGFHPDYALEWHVDGQVYRALVCFGCREVKWHGPDAELHCDITQAAFGEIQAILVSYQNHRPPRADEP